MTPLLSCIMLIIYQVVYVYLWERERERGLTEEK